MQLFSCPFCGPRDETEFTFGAEAGKVRPEPAPDVSAQEWSAYLHLNHNPKGATREIWVHNACGEFFLMERDTLSQAVTGSQSLRKSDEHAPALPGGGETYGTLAPGAEAQKGGAPS